MLTAATHRLRLNIINETIIYELVEPTPPDTVLNLKGNRTEK